VKILIPTIGSRGDVQPFIALAKGLTRAGHVVTLASHPIMGQLVQSHGVNFAPIGPDIDLASEVAALRYRAHNPILGLIRGMRFGFDLLDRAHTDILALCRTTELVVVPAAAAIGKNEADLLHLPYLSVTFMPWSIPWRDPARPILKQIGYGLFDKLLSLITTLPLNRRRKRLGLPPVGAEGFTSSRLNLAPVSPSVFPPNPLWAHQHQLTGYWFADPPQDWQPSTSLRSYLESGDPPLLVTLGAMSLGDEDARENAQLFTGAIQQTGIRAIIQGWDAGMQQLKLPDTVFASGALPHSWLLPRCAGIVHHGGFGTTSAGFRAGVPHLVLPSIADQFYWGQRVHQLGVGLPFIPRPRLTADKLTAALRELSSNSELRAAASTLGEQILSENGLDVAVRLIVDTFT